MLNRRDIDVREVGARLAALALGEAAGRVPDMAGPEIRTVEDLARTYLTAVRKRRPIISVRLPGRVCRAYRAGGHLAPHRAGGAIRFERYLGEQLAAGTLPYDDAIRDYTWRVPREEAR